MFALNQATSADKFILILYNNLLETIINKNDREHIHIDICYIYLVVYI